MCDCCCCDRPWTVADLEPGDYFEEGGLMYCLASVASPPDGIRALAFEVCECGEFSGQETFHWDEVVIPFEWECG